MAGLYLVGAWLLVQVADTVLPAFAVPEWVLRAVILVMAIGFVPALVFAWVFELTPQGIKRDADVDPAQSIGPQTARRMERVTLALLALAVLYFSVDKFVLSPSLSSMPSDEQAFAPQAAAAATAAPRDKSIAVLPFENLSEDKANGYFADGVQDQILTGLAKIGALKVISRTSTQRYASRPDNLSQIARELGVAHILEGSVQRAGNRVRINVQLIDAASDSHLWADTYDRTLDDIFAVESEVAQKIAQSLAATLTQGELIALEQKPTENPQAYAAYLKARVLAAQVAGSRSHLDETLAAYREAVQLDPGFALAWAELARIALLAGWTGVDPTGALKQEAQQAMATATTLAPNAPQVEMTRAIDLYYDKRDFAGAYAVINTVKSALPGDVEVWAYSGFLARRLGLWEAAVADFKQAHAIAPNDPDMPYHLGVTLGGIGDCRGAITEFDASIALQPDNPSAFSVKLLCLWKLGDLSQIDRVLSQTSEDLPIYSALRGIQAFYHRDYSGASRLLRDAIASDQGTQSDMSFSGYIPAAIDWRLQLGVIEQRAGHAEAAQASFVEVRAAATDALARTTNSRYVEIAWRAALGLSLAGLGEAESAATEGRRAAAMLPESEDRLESVTWQYYLAQIYAMNGNAADCVPLLAHLLNTPAAFLGVAQLQFDPTWDLVRNDPAFKALISQAQTTTERAP